jgi:hypothetical protein
MSWNPAEDPRPGDKLACDALETMIVPRARDLGSFEVRRALPSAQRQWPAAETIRQDDGADAIFGFSDSQGQCLSSRPDLPDGTAKAFAVLAHCLTCSKNSITSVRIARTLAARGIGILRFDLTG